MTTNPPIAPSPVEPLTVLDRAYAYLNARQDEMTTSLRLNDCDRFAFTPHHRQLHLSRKGKLVIIADIQIVGTISTSSQSWLWGWANQHLDPASTRDLLEVRRFGEDNEDLDLVTPYVQPADFADAWAMTSVAALVLRAKGAYCAPHEGGATFAILTDVRRVAQK